MKAPPLVGLTSYTPSAPERTDYYLPSDYVHALARAGADAVLLVGGDTESVLGRISGLVLSGGGDMDPACYGGETHPANYMIDAERDRYELALARGALQRGMPIFAICRGMQIMNVALGGTLITHVPDVFGDGVDHRLPPREPVAHDVAVERESAVLGAAAGREALEVMSWHHQAVDRLGEGLRVVARASDGVVEAVELEAESWFLGVQWHPELNAATNPRQAALFEAFAEAVSSQQRHGLGS